MKLIDDNIQSGLNQSASSDPAEHLRQKRSDIENIFLVLKELIEKQKLPVAPKRKIGFRRNNETD